MARSLSERIAGDLGGVGGLLSGGVDSLGSVQLELRAVEQPAGAGDESLSIQAEVNGIELGGIEQVVAKIAEQLLPLVAELPAANDVIAPLSTALALLQDVAVLNLPANIEALAARLDAEFNGREGWSATAQAVTELLANEPSLAALRDLLERLTGLAGFDLQAQTAQLPQRLTGLLPLLPALRALMQVHSVLADAAQLSRVMRQQLDAERLENGFRFLLEQWGSAAELPLVDFIAGADLNDPVTLATLRQQLGQFRRQFQGLLDQLINGMAFGEATLVHLDPPALLAALEQAKGLIRGADVAPLEQLLEQVRNAFAPLVTIDFNAVPALALEDLLTQIEARVAEVAADIDAFDVQRMAAPVVAGIAAVEAIPAQLSQALDTVTLQLQAALEQVRAAVAQLPIDRVVGVIRQVLQPLQAVLARITALVEQVRAALELVAGEVQTHLQTAENVTQDIRDQVAGLFEDVAQFIDGLPIESTLGAIGDGIQQLADLIAQADMSPYFDAVSDAIGTTADIVDKVPFELLPDSMEQEMVDAIRPVKSYDVEALKRQVESLLQITDDGEFAARGQLLDAIAEVQARYDELLAEIASHDPRELVRALAEKIDELRGEIQQLVPAVALQPLTDAQNALSDALDQIDLEQLLQPVYDGFDELVGLLDQYSPAQLIEPLDQQLDDARNQLLALLKIDQWAPQLDRLKAQALQLVDLIDPAQIEDELQRFVGELQQQTDRLPALHLGQALGSLIDALVASSGLQPKSASFTVVLDWLGGEASFDGLTALAGDAATAFRATRTAVEQLDPEQLIATLQPELDRVRAALSALPASAAREELLAVAVQLDLRGALVGVAANRQRYLTGLRAGEQAMTELANSGLSEVQIGAARFRVAFAPLRFIKEFFRALLAKLGIDSLELSLPALFRQLFEVATPVRLAAVMAPIFTALKGRVEALLDGVLNPLKDGIATLEDLINRFDLDPLQASLDAVHGAVQAQLAQLHPRPLLAGIVGEFEALKTSLQTPLLGPLETVLTDLRDTADRVLALLDPETLFEPPIAAYQRMLGRLGQLDIEQLLLPLINQLDALAAQVDSGLDDTTGAFQRLQAALPDRVGSTAVTVSASVSVGG